MNDSAMPWLAAALVSLAACGPASEPVALPPPAAPVANAGARLPTEPGPMAPSFARLAEGEVFDATAMTSASTCEGCHPAVAAEWKGSVHALSSFNNPLYRQVFDEFAGQGDRARSNHCGGCHDPALLFDGTLARQEISPEDPRAYAGIGCAHCHGITEASAEGNGSYVLSTSPIPIPVPGDDASLAAHRARVAPQVLRSDAFCMSCHRGFLSGGTGHDTLLVGNDEAGVWRRSAWGGSDAERIDWDAERKSCVDCHMPTTSGPATTTTGAATSHRAHFFAGGHTALADWAGATEQRAAIEALMAGVASLSIVPLETRGAGALPGQGQIQLGGGQVALLFDVVIFNEGVGHRFPGGARDLRDTWLEVAVFDAQGQKVAIAGGQHEATGEDPSAHRFRVLVADNKGQAVMDHTITELRTPVFDHTVGPRDAVAARYRWVVPPELRGQPLRVEAQLRHRRLHLPAARAACEGGRTERGAAFLAGTEEAMGWSVDPCRTERPFELARAERWIGQGEGASSPALDWIAYYRHGLALQKQVQEKLPEALASLELAAQLLPADAPPRARLAIELEQARVIAKQGRVQEAAQLLEALMARAPGEPAIPQALGDAWARLWQWPQAAVAYAAASEAAPRDDRTWRGLAISAGSAGDHARSLEAAHRGLAMEPRDAALLRSQMLALRHLAPGSAEAAAANASYLVYRPDDIAPRVRSACSKTSPECLRERTPLHIHELNVPGAPPSTHVEEQ